MSGVQPVSIKSLALRVLEEMAVRRLGANVCPMPSIAVGQQQARAKRETLASESLAPCGGSHCAGCYDVGDGKRIHPPKIGEEYRKWLERWKPKGKPQ
jgi:hypothetical protein